MKQEDKELLLKDLSGRLPYGVKLGFYASATKQTYICTLLGLEPQEDEPVIAKTENGSFYMLAGNVKPYLFPLSSMTEEQREELYKIGWYLDEDKIYTCFRNYDDANYKTHTDCFELINWCYKNNFDINGLIPKGLAVNATGLNIY